MAIAYNSNSFVQFNRPPITSGPFVTEVPFIVSGTVYDVAFQFKIENEYLPLDYEFTVGIVDSNGDEIYPNEYPVVPMCSHYAFISGANRLQAGHFPIMVNAGVIPTIVYETPEQFIDAIFQSTEVSIPGINFYNCCEVDVDSIGTLNITTMGSLEPVITDADFNLTAMFGYGYVDLRNFNIPIEVIEAGCFNFGVYDAEGQLIAISNSYVYNADPSMTTVLSYYNEGNGYGFVYPVLGSTDLYIPENVVRLEMEMYQPSWVTEEQVVTTNSGRIVRRNTQVSNVIQAHVGLYAPQQHRMIAIALKHDVIHAVYTRYAINEFITMLGSYTPDYGSNTKYNLVGCVFQLTLGESQKNNSCGFDCGIEIVDSCDGGATIPCPDKYMVEFVVGVSNMAPGDTVYSDINLSSALNVEVYKEGIFMHNSSPMGGTYVTFAGGANPSLPGTVTFSNPVTLNERIAIWVI